MVLYLLKGPVIAYDQRPLSVHIRVLETLSEEVNAKGPLVMCRPLKKEIAEIDQPVHKAKNNNDDNN